MSVSYGVFTPHPEQRFGAHPRILRRHLQYRVSPAKRVGHRFLGQWVRYPLAVHHQAVFIGSGRQSRFVPPVTNGGGMKNLGPGLPIVERSRHANADCFRIIELEANGHELKNGAVAIGMAAAMIMVLIVLHGDESDWFPWHHSFAEHFRHNKDDEGPKKASASQEID